MRPIINIIIALNVLFLSLTAYAGDQIQIIPPYNTLSYDAYLNKLYANQPENKRLEYFSAAFLGQPYKIDALGEGKEGEFDQDPLYRVDAFDCMTYVSTVLALVNAHNLPEFQQMIKKINYQDGVVSYQNRNHFTNIDWNANNEKQGFIKDITGTIHNQQNQSVAKMINVYINKKKWYEKKTLSSIKLLSPITSLEQQQLLEKLRGLKANVSNQESHVPYVPLTALFDKQGVPNEFIFAQIPSGSIIEIVRFNWSVRPNFGTELDISHLGFAVRTEKGLMYREASSIKNKVVDIPLETYLRDYLDSPTVRGINIQMILL